MPMCVCVRERVCVAIGILIDIPIAPLSPPE